MGRHHHSFEPMTSKNPVLKDFLGYSGMPERSTPGGWLVYHGYDEKYYKEIIDMELRDNDVWIVTYPKSGTTWMQSIVWLILNDLKFDSDNHMDAVSPHVECTAGKLLQPLSPTFDSLDQVIDKDKFIPHLQALKEKMRCDESFTREIDDYLQLLNTTPVKIAENIPRNRRRLLKSHLPFDLLPPDILKKNKVIFVARDPRDVVVSFFHHHRLLKFYDFQRDFQTFFDYFIDDEVVGGPFWEFIEQAWSLRANPNIVFIFFSEMKKDLRGVIQKVLNFLNLQDKYNEKDVEKIIDMVSLESMKANVSVDNSESMTKLGIYNEGKGTFLREGKSGGWKNVLTEDMIRRIDRWTKEKTAGKNVPLEIIYPESI